MWNYISSVKENCEAWVNEKINGEKTTAEYYNPIGQNDNEFNENNYEQPHFESKHLGEARLDRLVDTGLGMVEKYTNTKIQNGMVTNNAPVRKRADPLAKDLATDLTKPTAKRDQPKAPAKVPGEMTFVFHNSMQDTEERVCHDADEEPRRAVDELKYKISTNNSIICQRQEFPKFVPLSIFLQRSGSQLKYGDLLEFAADQTKSKWVVFIGFEDKTNVAYGVSYSQREQEIQYKSLVTLSKDRPVRRVNHVYAYKDVDEDRLKRAVQSIRERKLEKSFAENFNCSEAFAAWIRYQVDDFIIKKPSTSTFKLEIHLPGNENITSDHPSLVSAIAAMRTKQKEGTQSIVETRKVTKELLISF